MTTNIEMNGRESLTPLQAKALLKAGLAILMRSDFAAEDETLTKQERVSLEQAICKLEFRIRISS